MRVLLKGHKNLYNLVDYTMDRSCAWSMDIPTEQGLQYSLISWPSAKLPPVQRINYLLNDGYTIISIDDIPFAEWSAQHPEFFI